MDRLISQSITFLRFPLILLIIGVHVPGYGLFQLQFSNTADVITTATILALGRAAVCVFFIISGYLFFRSSSAGFTKSDYLTKLHHRVYSLLIPYIIWNTFALHWFAPETGCSVKTIIDMLLRNYGLYPLMSPFTFEPISPRDFPLWYVRDLMACSLLAPLIYRIMHRKVAGGIILASLAIPLLSPYTPCIIGLSPQALFFFSAGAYCALHGIDRISTPSKSRLWIITAVSAIVWAFFLRHDLCILCHPYRQAPVYHFGMLLSGSIFLISGAVSFCASFSWRLPIWLSTSSFFTYCAHGKILSLIQQYCPEGLPYLSYFLYLILAIAVICVGLYVILQRFVPGILGILNGSRNTKTGGYA